jgi:hypothetical protein
MKTIAERFQKIWDSLSKSQMQVPSRIEIRSDHIHNNGQVATDPFEPGEHYFEVSINEMYLTYDREWFRVFDPMVFVVSEFTYDKKIETVPFIVGPSLMQQFKHELPAGMIFSNTRVAGPYPYRGGRLVLSVILYKITRKNYIQQILGLVENTAAALSFSSLISGYLKVASVIVDGVETLFNTGEIAPIIGSRREFDPDRGDIFKPLYFALVDAPESDIDRDKLWVNNNQLFWGENSENITPFRDADYVLYSINQTKSRGDITTLPFYSLWEKVIREATVPMKDHWQSAKANMMTLYQNLMLSSDLTAKQAYELAQHYKEETRRLHNEAIELSQLGLGKDEPDDVKRIRKESLDILTW